MADTNGTAFDIVVLGAGSGGYATALRAAQLGKNVALVEADKVGGTCLHQGCIPTKALLHAAELADNAREGAHYGVHTTLERVDMAGVNQYKDSVIGGLYKGLQGLVKSRGITVVEGYGRLVGPNAVEVNGQTLTGEHVVLATGSYARSLPGLEIGGRVITSDQALQLDWVPQSAIILGGGVIGSEFASVWKSFGADVTIIEALPHLVPNEDEALSKAFERAFRKRGIKFNLASGSPASRRTTTACTSRSRTARRSTPTCCSWPSAAVRAPRASATRSRASRSTAVSSSPTRTCARASATSGPSATSSPACSSRTAASRRASTSRSRSAGSTPRRSSSPASRA